MENNRLENSFIKASIEDEILSIEYKPDIKIYLPVATQILEMLEIFCQQKIVLVLEDMSNIEWIDKQSRDYMAQHPFNAQMKAWAYCSSQPVHKLMYDIYNTFSKPRGNTAFFTSKEEGLKWILGFRHERLRLQ